MDLHLPELSSIKKIITCTVEGVIDEDDLRILSSGVRPSEADPEGMRQQLLQEAEDPGDLKKVRERHHSVARLVASGMAQELVATICNYTPVYLGILLNNPAMKELVEMYRMQNGQAAAVITERLRTVGLRAVEKLTERIDQDELNNNELIAVGKLGLDRSGHGPSSTLRNVNEHHILDHAELAELNRRARADSKEFIIPVEHVRSVLITDNSSQQAGPDPDLD